MSDGRHFDRAELDFDDPAFAPRSSFDFADEMNHMGHGMPDLDSYPGGEVDFDLMEDLDSGRDEFEADFFHGAASNPGFSHHGSGVGEMSKAGNAMANFSAMLEPPSMQNQIVSSRRDQVSQHFGQITPPDEVLASPFPPPPAKQSRSQESGKLSNEQRARNAANTRHSRPKTAPRKKVKTEEEEDDGSDVDNTQAKPGKNVNVQREKNRVAAAKCRAKKKTANEQQEEMASQFGATNNFLTREIRELKNQKTELQNYLLAHRPGVCECHGIHDYNLGQAQRLVMNARRQAAEPVASSPSQDSIRSGQSPASDSTSLMFSGPSPMLLPESLGQHSSGQPFDMAFGQMTGADFLQDPHGGQGGFT